MARWIEQATKDVLRIEEGSLYPALHRLETRGWIAADWGLSENNRRAKFYTLTAKGRAQMRVETATWTRFAQAVFAALEAPPQPSLSRSEKTEPLGALLRKRSWIPTGA